MKKAAAVLLILAIILVFSQSVSAEQKAPEETELYAKAAVLMDGDSGRVLYSKNGTECLANASTTKILTCIIALENCDENQTVTISALAAKAPKVHLGASEGQKFLMKDLLYAMMLESFNDCAVAIAEQISGTTEDFSVLMNDYAKKIGCKNTFFLTPNGLDAKTDSDFHHTTAEDLALIMRYCLKLSPKADAFVMITKTQEYHFSEADGSGNYHCYNHNAFLKMMDGAISGKTGFTGNAGYCYVGALERSGKTYIVALLACGWPNNRTYKWKDTKKLMEYGIAAFEMKNLDEIPIDESKLQPVPVENGQGTRIGEPVNVNLRLKKVKDTKKILLKENEKITVEYKIAEKLIAPVQNESCIGAVYYKLGNMVLREYHVETVEKIEAVDLLWCMKQVLKTAL